MSPSVVLVHAQLQASNQPPFTKNLDFELIWFVFENTATGSPPPFAGFGNDEHLDMSSNAVPFCTEQMPGKGKPW
jgi:hypothetical protein